MIKVIIPVSAERKLIGQLIQYRLKFYIQTTADAVQRHKHLILLVGLLAGPMIFAVLLALAKPLISILHAENMLESIKIWSIFLFIHLLWSSFQQKALNGGEGYQYIAMTPLTLRIRISVELGFLAPLSFAILLPFIIALVYVWATDTFYQAIIDSFLIVLWGIELLLIQMLVCQKNRYLIILCLASFLAPLSLVLFKVEILSIFISFILVAATYRQWMIAKISKPRNIQLPQVLRIQAKHSVNINWLRVSLRKILNKHVMKQHILFFIFAFSASVVLAWFAQQKDTWILLYIALSPLRLMNLMSAFYITAILLYIVTIKTMLASTYTTTARFWLSQGISNRQALISETVVLWGIAVIAALPTLIWIILSNGMVKSLFMIGLMMFAVALIQHIFRQPERVHGTVTLVLTTIWFVISYLLLSF